MSDLVQMAEKRYRESGGKGWAWGAWCGGYIHGWADKELAMSGYERMKAQKNAIIAEEKHRDAQSIIARLIPYLQHDYLCAGREVKGGGCTCGLDVLLWELQTGEPPAGPGVKT